MQTASQTAERKTVPFNATDFISLQLAAQRIADSAHVSYWLTGRMDDGGSGHHLSEIVKRADELAQWIDLLRATHPYFREVRQLAAKAAEPPAPDVRAARAGARDL